MTFYESNYYQELKKDICLKSGIAMQFYSDAMLLSASMETVSISLSTHTIARFFGFLPQRKIYPATLKLFCNYLGFNDFNEYVEHKKQTHSRSLRKKSDVFGDSHFTEYSFQLAMKLNDEIAIQNHLESINFFSESIEDLAHLTGFLIRSSEEKEKLLQILIQSVNGRRLFYERFVDEDDPGNYYSNALQRYYLKSNLSENNLLFYYCYLIANATYKNKKLDSKWGMKFNKLLTSIDVKQLHFHELSRIFETKVLLMKLPKQQKYLFLVIDDFFELLNDFDNHARCWLLARFLRALTFKKQNQFIAQNMILKDSISRAHNNSNVGSIGELIVQLYYHTFIDKSEQSPVPLGLNSRYTDNEFSTRISVETATKLHYTSGEEYNYLKRKLEDSSELNGTNWVRELLM